jgi:hypothetical protein
MALPTKEINQMKDYKHAVEQDIATVITLVAIIGITLLTGL